MIKTEAWVLHQDPGIRGLQLESFEFDDLRPDEALVEPIFGCWEANMAHAIHHDPVNIARLRREKRIVLGNAGVARVIQIGPDVTNVAVGDLCMFMPAAELDDMGYLTAIHGYDGRGTVGFLAKRTKCRGEQLLPLPRDTRFSPQQWAAFSLRYMTAWSNWKVTIGAYRLQVSEIDMPRPTVWGWGGGSTLAILDLARRMGSDAFMISGSDAHLTEIRRLSIDAVDRRAFPDLAFEAERFEADVEYRKAYLRSEREFMRIVREKTNGHGASIFVDFIGSPVFRASTRALARQGVLTTAGWKCGMDLLTNRANECIRRHIHVFTHGARRGEEIDAVRFAEETGWMPEVTAEYGWNDIPRLTEDFDATRVGSYFPVYVVNAA